MVTQNRYTHQWSEWGRFDGKCGSLSLNAGELAALVFNDEMNFTSFDLKIGLDCFDASLS